MGRLSRALAALAFGCCLPASAAVFNWEIHFLQPDFSSPGVDATGTIETTEDTGVFTLASGVSGFSVSGVVHVAFFLSGPFALDSSGLSFLELTLLDGVVQGFRLATNTFTVPAQVYGEGPVEIFQANFAVDGLGDPNAAMVVFNRFNDNASVLGHATITPIPEPPAIALFATGLGVLGATWRRRRKRELQRS